MNKPEAIAHAIIACDKLHADGDLDEKTYINTVDLLKVVAQRARLVQHLDYLVDRVNAASSPTELVDRSLWRDELLTARDLHGELAVRRLEQLAVRRLEQLAVRRLDSSAVLA